MSMMWWCHLGAAEISHIFARGGFHIIRFFFFGFPANRNFREGTVVNICHIAVAGSDYLQCNYSNGEIPPLWISLSAPVFAESLVTFTVAEPHVGCSYMESCVARFKWVGSARRFASRDVRALWQSQEKSSAAHPVEKQAFLLFHNRRPRPRPAPAGAALAHVPTWGFQSTNHNRFILNVKTLEGL